MRPSLVNWTVPTTLGGGTGETGVLWRMPSNTVGDMQATVPTAVPGLGGNSSGATAVR